MVGFWVRCGVCVNTLGQSVYEWYSPGQIVQSDELLLLLLFFFRLELFFLVNVEI